MFALSILLFLILAVVSLVVEFKYQNPRWRLASYATLMSLGLLVVAYHYYCLSPQAVVNRLEIQGQYFPTDSTIRISGDPAVADYYAPSMLPRAEESGSAQESPNIQISGYDDKQFTLQVTARDMTRLLRHNDEVVNMRPLNPGDEVRAGPLLLKFENGLLSRSRFVVGGMEYLFAWPSTGAAVPVSELLCQGGMSREKQSEAFRAGAPAADAAEVNPLDYIWLVRQEWGSVGLVNGSAVPVTVGGIELPSEYRFVVAKDDRLVYGVGRRLTSLTVDVDPTVNRIYLLPERPLSYPLFHAPDDAEANVFISSAPTIADPAYQLALGERNRDLVRGSLRYRFEGGAIKEFVLNSGIDQRSFKALETAALGTAAGGVLLRLTDNKMAHWRPLVYVGAVWLAVGLLFYFLGGIGHRNYLFVLLPAVQMILAIRLVLSYRAYVLPPYYQESYEKALFALVFVPFIIFTWLYLRRLTDSFDMSGYVMSDRKLFGRAGWNIARSIFVLPPFMYLLVSVAMMWMTGIASFERVLLVVAFFVLTVLGAWFLSTARDWARNSDPLLSWLSHDRLADMLLLFGLPLLMAGFLRLSGLGTEAIPGTPLRAELIYLPCLLLASCRFYMWFFKRHFGVPPRAMERRSLLLLAVPFASYFMLAWLVGDWGFLIYSVPVLFLAVIVSWRADPKVTGASVLLVLAVLALFIWSPLFTEQVAAVLPHNSNIEYRYLAYQNPGWLQEAVLEASDGDGGESFWQKTWRALGSGPARRSECMTAAGGPARRILGIHEHFWTMYHYAARGSGGVGYGEAPIERVPFANGIAQSDNLYSIYVMSEHGSLGAMALVALYLFVALLMLFILVRHFSNELEPTLIVGGVTLTILFAAFYHAAGNVNGVPFTGKNFPLLSLNSTADVLLVGLLLAIALSVIGNGRDTDLPDDGRGLASAFMTDGNMLNRWLLLLAAVFSFIFFPAVSVWTARAAADQNHRAEYDLAGFVERVKQYLNDRVITLDENNRRIELHTERAKGLAERQYLRVLRDQFNSAPLEEKQSGKYFFVLKEQVLDEDLYGPESRGDRYRETVLTVDQNYFRRPSPFAEKVGWHGDLLSSDASEGKQGYLVGEGVNLSLQHVLDADEPIPGAPEKKDVVVANPGRPVNPGEFYTGRRFHVRNRRGKELFNLYAVEADTVLDPRAEGTFVNGQPVSDKTRLEPGDIIAIKGSPQTDHRNLVFAFHREQGGMLARSHWVNGREEFTFPQNEMFALARPIAEAINARVGAMALEGRKDAATRAASVSLSLSLNADLNRRIYRLLAEEAEGYTNARREEVGGLWQEVSRRRGLPPRIAVTAMNPQTGEVLALASWPSFDPNPQAAEQERLNPRSYSNLLRSHGPTSQRYLQNHNFTRHVIGSATKPFVAAAAATAYPQLLSLVVTDDAATYEQVLGVSTPPAWQGGGMGVVNWNRFLGESNNLYAVTIGFMGLSNGSGQGLRFSRQATRQHYQLDGHDSTLQPDFADVLDSNTGAAVKLEHTPLASQLNSLFDIQVSGPDPDPLTSVWRGAQARSLLPEQGGGLAFISPEVPNLSLNNVQHARSFVGVCLGGNTNLWSNVKSAEAFSRLVTGRRVNATMVKEKEPVNFTPLDSAFVERVRPALLEALEGVVAGPNGTAAVLLPSVNAVNGGTAAAGGERFAIFAKTGTLEGQFRSGRNDSNIIFAAGWYNPATRTFRDGVVVSVFIEKGNRRRESGRATALAVRLFEVLSAHFNWPRPTSR